MAPYVDSHLCTNAADCFGLQEDVSFIQAIVTLDLPQPTNQYETEQEICYWSSLLANDGSTNLLAGGGKGEFQQFSIKP